ncbi:MAG: hypothetical protein V3V11_03240 [Vicinamibacteria bacterium]
MTKLKVLGVVFLGALILAGGFVAAKSPGDFTKGTPEIQSMSALTFTPDGVLFIGDGKGGAIFAVDLQEESPATAVEKAPSITNIEEKIASLLGTTANEIMIHDMAVSPVSQNIYLSVSRGRSSWDSRWLLPNDIADAGILLKVSPEGEIGEVALKDVAYATAALPNPVDASKTHQWKEGISLRADTITDMSFSEGTLYVAGLSNEEFSSTMWRMPFPFSEKTTATTLEIFHGAHGEYETHAPIRAFVPFPLNGKSHLLAAYLCTPLVTFPVADLRDGQHVKGRTVGEFGSGNYPIDMVLYQKDGEDRLLIANSNLPFMIVKTKDVESYKGEITTEVEGYLAGVPYEPRSGTGVQQLDAFNADYVVALQRLPGGTMDMVALPLRRF